MELAALPRLFVAANANAIFAPAVSAVLRLSDSTAAALVTMAALSSPAARGLQAERWCFDRKRTFLPISPSIRPQK